MPVPPIVVTTEPGWKPKKRFHPKRLAARTRPRAFQSSLLGGYHRIKKLQKAPAAAIDCRAKLAGLPVEIVDQVLRQAAPCDLRQLLLDEWQALRLSSVGRGGQKTRARLTSPACQARTRNHRTHDRSLIPKDACGKSKETCCSIPVEIPVRLCEVRYR